MATPEPPIHPTRLAGIRNYEYLCLAALLVILLVLFERGRGVVCLVPFLVGLGGIAARWRLALPMLLIALAFALSDQALVRWTASASWEPDPLTNWLLCAAVLGYTAGQQRLQGVARHLVAPDPGSPEASRDPLQQPGRRTDYVRELALFAGALVAWAGLAPIAWYLLPASDFGLFGGNVWRLVVLAWMLGLALVIANGVLTFAHRRWRTRDESAMFLQDLLWRQTRREQSRWFRWRAWARLRRERKGR
jgi:hypothetical protein